MTLLGTDFSPVFADVILVADAVTILLVLALFHRPIGAACARALHLGPAALERLATLFRHH